MKLGMLFEPFKFVVAKRFLGVLSDLFYTHLGELLRCK